MTPDKYVQLFPRASRNSNTRWSTIHLVKVSSKVAVDILHHVTDDEAATLPLSRIVRLAGERSGNGDRSDAGYVTYTRTDALIDTPTPCDQRRAGAGLAFAR